ncbi:type II secretion system F family protein [Actinomadura logoneensis]|uniref:Type II secretion system F family protein n=1 Tax=Actinomadura logoneensis TaxID=2293572 RepID=A0A372JBG5_9ACTN|nr:type II secretion system F family protein [Actinomadura logoneensis]RFU37302.1 type II secretion system F family protein [Actinomadura logoneensis]
MTIPYLLAAGAALCVVLLVWALAALTSGGRVSDDALPAAGAEAKDEQFILDRITERLGAPFARPMMDLLAPWRAKIRMRIDQAGRPGGMTVDTYARRLAGYLVLFGTLALLVLLQGHPFWALLVLLAALQPDLSLYAKRAARQDEIQRSMPDFLDVLAVTVSAGLSFRTALARVCESMPGALSEEFMVALRQMELGTPRREAFDDLRDRNNSEAVGSFATALLQAEELGAPLGQALVDISNDMRRESAQWARRKAQRANPKITAVTMGMSMPGLMMIVITAMVYGMNLRGVGGLFGG